MTMETMQDATSSTPIAMRQLLEAGVHFGHNTGFQQMPDHGTVAGEGRDEAGDDDQAGIDQDLARMMPQ